MTGRDLIIYILSNNLEDKPVFEDGTFMGFMTVEAAAVKMHVGVETIRVWINRGFLDYCRIGDTYLIPVDCKLKDFK